MAFCHCSGKNLFAIEYFACFSPRSARNWTPLRKRKSKIFSWYLLSFFPKQEAKDLIFLPSNLYDHKICFGLTEEDTRWKFDLFIFLGVSVLRQLRGKNWPNLQFLIKNFPGQWQNATVYVVILQGWVNPKMKKVELYPSFSHFLKF